MMDPAAFRALHAELVASGMDPTEAAAEALKRFTTNDRLRNTREAEETYAREIERWRRADLMVPTMKGPVHKGTLGVTMFREHLMYRSDASTSSVDDPVEISRLATIRSRPFEFRQNCAFGPSEAESELRNYVRSGGRTIVEVTPIGRRAEQHVKTIQSLLRDDVVVVRGVGVEVDSIVDVSGLVRRLAAEFRPPHSAGVIGEIVLSRVDADRNRAVLSACAEAQGVLGGEVPLLIVVDTLQQIEHVMKHMLPSTARKIVFAGPGVLSAFRPDRVETLRVLLDTWTLLFCVDMHGSEIVRKEQHARLPSIEEIARSVALLLKRDSAYAARLVFGHAQRFKTQLARYGGFGCARFLHDFAPRLRRLLSDDTLANASLRSMVVENPARLLSSYRPPKPKRSHVTTWTCAQCARRFDDADEQFTRMSFVYCSIECLQNHRKGKRAFDDEMQRKRARERGEEDEEDGGTSGGRGPAGAWGVCT
eukprot:g2934.t1